MARFETWFEQDLKKPIKVQYLRNTLFTMDNEANLIGVRLFENGTPATLSGSVSATIIRPDEQTVPIAGVVSGNEVSVVLPQAVYAYNGSFSLVIKLTTDNEVTTVCAAVGTIFRSETEAVVDPGTLITDINTLIARINEAVESIPMDYSVLSDEVADIKNEVNDGTQSHSLKRSNNQYNWRDGFKNWKYDSKVVTTSLGVSFIFPYTGSSQRQVVLIDDCTDILSTATAVTLYVFSSTPVLDSTGTSVSSISITSGVLKGGITQETAGYAMLTVMFASGTSADTIRNYGNKLSRSLMVAPLASGYNLPYSDYYLLDIKKKNLNSELNSDTTLAKSGEYADSKTTGNSLDALVLPDKQRSYNLYNLRDGYKNWDFADGKIKANNKAVAFVMAIPSGRTVFRIDDCSSIIDLATAKSARWDSASPAVGDSVTVLTIVYSSGAFYGTCNQNSNGYGVISFTFGNNTEAEVEVFARTLKKHLVIAPLESGYVLPYKDYYIPKYDSDEMNDETKSKLNQNKWYGKKIWWCGTSIPEGQDTAIGSEGNGLTYPGLVGKLLGATVINKSLGSSMCRANVRTGNYVNALSHNLIFSLSQTAEEKQYLIDNWSTIRQVLNDPNTYESLSSISSNVIGASFESRLMPYLDGTYDMPDLFVFDHGHNDWKTFYTMPDGTTPDTELKPTTDNISGNILAEDTYMTANSNAKLISFFTEISAIPQSKRNAFIASVNRNCFIGAVNFLCTLILSKNPRARIVFIGNLDNWAKPQVQPAQDYLANSWEFPIIRMWEYTGFCDHYIPNTATFWSDTGTTDLTMKQIYCKDGVHPHSDTTGDTIPMYAHIIANALKGIN